VFYDTARSCSFILRAGALTLRSSASDQTCRSEAAVLRVFATMFASTRGLRRDLVALPPDDHPADVPTRDRTHWILAEVEFGVEELRYTIIITLVLTILAIASRVLCTAADQGEAKPCSCWNSLSVSDPQRTAVIVIVPHVHLPAVPGHSGGLRAGRCLSLTSRFAEDSFWIRSGQFQDSIEFDRTTH